MASRFPMQPVLAVDDEESFLRSVRLILASDGIDNVATCTDSRQVLDLLSRREPSVVLLDLSMPHLSGRELLPMIVRDHPLLPVVMVTGVSEVDTAVECMKSGAFDYLVKPVDSARLTTTVRRAVELEEIQDENVRLKEYLLTDSLKQPQAFESIITASRSMRSIFQYIEAVAGTRRPVLITGETGVGKELIARALHQVSGREGRFVAVNVAGLDDSLFSDTLFGHLRGAFTGADRDRQGLIEEAAAGTLFLDEIGDLSGESQIKLLRLLQDGLYHPLGADRPRRNDARIVVATNRDLRARQASGDFRQDLYYRLQAHQVVVPPLRERPEDIACLVDHFLKKAARELGKRKPTSPRQLVTLLSVYDFPGNVRELEGLIFDAVSTHRSGVLSLKGIRTKIGAGPMSAGQTPSEACPSAVQVNKRITFSAKMPTLKEAEQMVIKEALRRAGQNQTIAAELLGMTRRALGMRLSRAFPKAGPSDDNDD